MKLHRIVLDTNVLVSALMSKLGNPAKIYRMFLSETVLIVFSDEIMDEYIDVLHRPHLKLSSDDVNKVINAIKLFGECIEPVPSTFPMIDEDDRIFYDVANSAGAYLITGNKRHYPDEPFIFTPADFLDL